MAGTIARAAVVGLIGLILGEFDSGVAVILVNYGFLFLCAPLFLGLSSRALAIARGGVDRDRAGDQPSAPKPTCPTCALTFPESTSSPSL